MDTSAEVIIPPDKHVVFFDGVCNLCNSSVDFIIGKDPDALFVFVSLQSPLAHRLVPPQLTGETGQKADSILVRTNKGQWLNKSSAALFIATHLKGWPSLLTVFKIIPQPVRDLIYDVIAKNRYRVFGQASVCRMPTPELAKRFPGTS